MTTRSISALQDQIARGTLEDVASAYNGLWSSQTSKAHREGITTRTLKIAMEFSRFDVLQYLIDLRDIVPSVAFLIAADCGHLESLVYLMEKVEYVRVRPTATELFQRAIHNDNLNIVKYLVRSQNVNVDQFQLMLKTYRDFASNNDNVYFLEFYDDKNFSINDFHDGDHLNENGAKKLSKLIDEIIKDINKL